MCSDFIYANMDLFWLLMEVGCKAAGSLNSSRAVRSAELIGMYLSSTLQPA